VDDDAGVARWIGVLLNYVRLDIPRDRLPSLGALARRLDPGRLRHVVAPGRIGSAGAQSVVYLTRDAARLFEDLRADAVIGGADVPAVVESEASTTTTTAGTGGGGATSTTSTAPQGTTTTSAPVGEPTTSTSAPPEETTSTTRERRGFFDEPDSRVR
jgi:hypothetical protein